MPEELARKAGQKRAMCAVSRSDLISTLVLVLLDKTDLWSRWVEDRPYKMVVVIQGAFHFDHKKANK